MNHTLETTLNDDRLGSLGRKSNADNIFRISKNGSKVLKHQI